MFFMMSKRKILKGIEQHLANTYYCKVDVELDKSIPPEMKEKTIIELRNKYLSLLKIRGELKELLIGS